MGRFGCLSALRFDEADEEAFRVCRARRRGDVFRVRAIGLWPHRRVLLRRRQTSPLRTGPSVSLFEQRQDLLEGFGAGIAEEFEDGGFDGGDDRAAIAHPFDGDLVIVPAS